MIFGMMRINSLKKIMAVKEKITKKKNEKGRMRIFDYNISLLMLCKRGIFCLRRKMVQMS